MGTDVYICTLNILRLSRVLSACSSFCSNFTNRKVLLGAFNTEINLYTFSCETLNKLLVPKQSKLKKNPLFIALITEAFLTTMLSSLWSSNHIRTYIYMSKTSAAVRCLFYVSCRQWAAIAKEEKTCIWRKRGLQVFAVCAFRLNIIHQNFPTSCLSWVSDIYIYIYI